MKNVHALLFGRMFTCSVPCSQGGCKRTFRYSHTLQRHIERNHAVVHADREERYENGIVQNNAIDGEPQRVVVVIRMRKGILTWIMTLRMTPGMILARKRLQRWLQ